MLGLKIASPGYLVIKLIIVFLKNLNCLGVGHMTELRVQHTI